MTRLSTILFRIRMRFSSQQWLRASVLRLLQEREAIEAALDEWAPLDPGEQKSLPDRIRDEGKDFNMLVDHLSETYCHFSGGQISKPNTLPGEVFAVAEQLLEEDLDELVREEIERRKAEEADDDHLAELEARYLPKLVPNDPARVPEKSPDAPPSAVIEELR